MRAFAWVIVGVTATAVSLSTSHLARMAYLAVFTLVVVASWLAVRRSTDDRPIWGLTAVAMTLWVTGDYIAEFAVSLGPSGWDWATVADVCWLAAYPALFVSIMMMAGRRGAGQLFPVLVDGGIMAMAAAVATWQFLILPAVDTPRPLPELAIDVAYPFADLILLAGGLFLILSPGIRGAPSWLLLGGLVLMLMVDIGFDVVTVYWPAAENQQLDGLALICNSMIVAAVTHPRRSELVTAATSVHDMMHPTRIVFLGFGFVTAPVLAVLNTNMSREDRYVLLAASIVAVGLGLTRFVGAIRASERIQVALADQAARDTLTGLSNRRFLSDRLTELADRQRPFQALYLDLDGFKHVNDQYGHAAGDTVLIEIAHRLKRLVRNQDTVARLGGDEFVILCEDIDQEQAESLGRRLLTEVSQPIAYQDHDLTVGVSIGVCTHSDGLTGDDLLHQADSAMLKAKRGRYGLLVSPT